jgi:hypothetical protein
MATPFDWLGYAGVPQTNLMVPPVGPRPYSLTAEDALALGRETADIYKQGADMQRLQMEQALAPQRFEYEQNKLAYDTALMQERARGRDTAIPAFGQLDPTAADYLRKRQEVIAANPYSLSDPTIQQILSSNDRAYDDFLAAKRLEAYGESGELTFSNIMRAILARNDLQEQLKDATIFEEPGRVDQINRSIAVIDAALAKANIPGAVPGAVPGAMPGAVPGAVPGAEPAPAAGKKATAPAAQDTIEERAKRLAYDLTQMADNSGMPTTELLRDLLEMGEDERRDFFEGLGYSDKDIEAVFKKLQRTPNLLQGMGASMRDASTPPGAPAPPLERGGFKITPIPD